MTRNEDFSDGFGDWKLSPPPRWNANDWKVVVGEDGRRGFARESDPGSVYYLAGPFKIMFDRLEQEIAALKEAVTYSKDSQPTLKRVPSVEKVFFTDLANRISALEEREEHMAKAVISLIMRIDDLEKEVGIRQ